MKSIRVKTIDIAPTIAKMLKIDFPQSVDGKVISIE
jgi:hypothetical protein